MRGLGKVSLLLLFWATVMRCIRDVTERHSIMDGQETVRGVGAVIFVTIEGGFYAIQSDEGPLYDPRNLPDDFKVDGLRVRFTVRVISDAIGFHMVGPIVEVLEIQRLV